MSNYSTTEGWLNEAGRRKPRKKYPIQQGSLFSGFLPDELIEKHFLAEQGRDDRWQKFELHLDTSDTSTHVTITVEKFDGSTRVRQLIIGSNRLSVLLLEVLREVEVMYPERRLKGL